MRKSNNTRENWKVTRIGQNLYCEPPRMERPNNIICNGACRLELETRLALDYHYTECGLPNVFISEIFVHENNNPITKICSGCHYISIPKMSDLHERIAYRIIMDKRTGIGKEAFYLNKFTEHLTDKEFDSLLKRLEKEELSQ